MDKNILLFVGVVHTRLGQSELNLSGGLESLVGLHCGYMGGIAAALGEGGEIMT